MAKEVNLGDVIRNSAPKENTTETTTEPTSLVRSTRHRSLTQAAAAAAKSTTPKFVQLRGDQQIELDVLARELQAARTTKQERITANTVIRVAVDLVLARRSALVGDTEEELRESLVQYVKRLEDYYIESQRDQESEGS